MNNRRVALVIFLIALILLSAGFIVFFSRQISRKSTLQTNLLKTAPAGTATTSQAAKNSAAAKPAPATFTDAQINAKIAATKQQINSASKGRSLTDDELYFLSFPKEAALQKLQQGQ
jgi:hypothetical protein